MLARNNLSPKTIENNHRHMKVKISHFLRLDFFNWRLRRGNGRRGSRRCTLRVLAAALQTGMAWRSAVALARRTHGSLNRRLRWSSRPRTIARCWVWLELDVVHVSVFRALDDPWKIMDFYMNWEIFFLNHFSKIDRAYLKSFGWLSQKETLDFKSNC